MSGVRRKTKYRKNVETDVLDSLPEPADGEEVVRIVCSRGGNLLEVEAADLSRALCRLPQRYRKVVWVKRGMLLIVKSCSEDFKTAGGENGKVKYVVSHVVFTSEQTKHLRSLGVLPACFDEQKEDAKVDDPMSSEGNLNRRRYSTSSSSSSDSDGHVETSNDTSEEDEDEDEEDDA